MIWAFQADWDREVRLSYEFMTEVITSENGSEQRIANRTAPRVRLEYTSLVAEFDYQLAASRLHLHQNQEVMMPDWSRPVSLRSGAAIGDDRVEVKRVVGWMRPGVSVGMIWDGPMGVEAAEGVVDSTSGNWLYLTDVLGVSIPQDAVIYRTLPGRIDSKVTARMHSDRLATLSVKFEVEPGFKNLSPVSTPPRMFDEWELFTTEPDWSSDINMDYEAVLNTIDYGKGRVYRTIPVPFKTRTIAANYKLIGRSEVTAMIDFFRRMRGQQGEFLMPTFTEDMRLRSDATLGANTLRLIGVQAEELFSTSTVLKKIAVVYEDGQIEAYGIDSATVVSDATGTDSVFSLDRPLVRAASRSDVSMVCWLPVWRLLSDELVVSWETDEHATVGLSMKTLETQTAEVF